MYKRFETRRSLVIPIELITPQWDEPINLYAGDLSPRGVYVKADLMPQAGEHVVCSFKLERGRPEYCFFGEVTRINMLRRQTDRGRPGFGIEFLDITPLQRLSIRHSLRGLPPPVPGSRRTPIQFANVDSLLA